MQRIIAGVKRAKAKTTDWLAGGPPEAAEYFDRVRDREEQEILRLRALRLADQIIAAFDGDAGDPNLTIHAGGLEEILASSSLTGCFEAYMENRTRESRATFLRQLAPALTKEAGLRLQVETELNFKNPLDHQPVGLAFSGGGIRSATFNLGVLQGLAQLNLLEKVDYLSTVSGGGYIGSWLIAWIKRQGFEAVNQQLKPPWKEHGRQEPPQIRFLRDYSNYLTPELGLLSADSWTAVTTFLRNLLLNLIILVLVTTAVLLAPRLLLVAFNYFTGVATLVVSLLVLTASFIFFAYRICTIWVGGSLDTAGSGGQSRVFAPILAPFFVGAFLLTGWIAKNPPPWPLVDDHLALIVGMDAILLLVLWAIVGEILYSSYASVPKVVFYLALASYLLLSLPSSVWAVSALRVHLTSSTSSQVHLLTFGVPLYLLASLGGGALQIGLTGLLFRNYMREWTARLGAWILIAIVLWVVLFVIVFYSPVLVIWGWERVTAGVASAGGLVYVLYTVFGTIAAWSNKTGKPGSRGWFDVLAESVPPVFAMTLLVLLSFGINKLITFSEAGQLALGLAGALIAGILLSTRVDINDFSIHLFYRNRLIRCYLGASRLERHTDPVTGFDPKDDLFLKDLVAEGVEPYTGPYPIINTTLNMTHGEKLAWQERKAGSFIMTPLFCGFDVSRSELAQFAGHPDFRLAKAAYRPTPFYAYPNGGVCLGTAFAISGAAASPNMGHYTRPAVAFLMAVFNVRLGWWLANPWREDEWQEGGPKIGLQWLVAELFANTNDRSSYVYLSDGGHFENLGIYELVRRRCRMIVACDATADEKYKFGDLGNAIRKCRDDFGVEIEIKLGNLRGEGDPRRTNSHVALGIIHYELVREGDKPGVLIYVKASLTEKADEPADVLEYAASHPGFPHDTTADQWFSESQFESYKRLGQHILEDAGNQCVSELIRETSSWCDLGAKELEEYLAKQCVSLYGRETASTCSSTA